MYLDFVLAIATEGQWDVLVPMHDQAFSFFRERASFALAVADFTRSSEFRARQCLSDVLTLEGPVNRTNFDVRELQDPLTAAITATAPSRLRGDRLPWYKSRSRSVLGRR